jgi:hypothetical protein
VLSNWIISNLLRAIRALGGKVGMVPALTMEPAATEQPGRRKKAAIVRSVLARSDVS